MFREQNPLPYLAHYPDADVLTSSDQVVPTVVDDRLDIWQEGEDYIKLKIYFHAFFDCTLYAELCRQLYMLTPIMH